MEVKKPDNEFLLIMDSHAFLYLHENDVNLSDVSFLDFRKFMYKKYFKEEEDVEQPLSEPDFLEAENISYPNPKSVNQNKSEVKTIQGDDQCATCGHKRIEHSKAGCHHKFSGYGGGMNCMCNKFIFWEDVAKDLLSEPKEDLEEEIAKEINKDYAKAQLNEEEKE